ncbi:MAG: hypothetical protein ACYDDU_12780 [Dermatophilaceae bacterium]
MASKWKPIDRVGTPKFTAMGPSLVHIEALLTAAPPKEWHYAFIEFEKGVERSTFMFSQNPNLANGRTATMFFRNPDLFGDRLSVDSAREEDLPLWFKLIDAKIAGANAKYKSGVAPVLAAAEKKRAAEAQRRAKAQARVDEIAQGYSKP